MWLEYIRYRFRLHRGLDLLELTQVAALKALRNSPRCQGWRVVPAADDPSHLVLEIEWDPGTELVPFRGSDEFAAIHSALASSARSLEEADYSVDSRLLRRVLGGPETLFRLAEDIVADVLMEPLLAWRFQSRDGSKRGRLGLWKRSRDRSMWDNCAIVPHFKQVCAIGLRSEAGGSTVTALPLERAAANLKTRQLTSWREENSIKAVRARSSG